MMARCHHPCATSLTDPSGYDVAAAWSETKIKITFLSPFDINLKYNVNRYIIIEGRASYFVRREESSGTRSGRVCGKT